MAYTVTASGDFNRTYSYFTINGTKYYASGTWTFDSKPTISVYVSSPSPAYRDRCSVTLNGKTVASYGEYALSIDEDIVDIALVFSNIPLSSSYYYTVDITASVHPMTPKDGHNTNIGAAAYQIEGGTVLFGGAAYALESGMTLIGGVAMEIPFKPSVCIVTITGTGHQNICYVEIRTTKHYTAKTLEVEPGTVVTFHAQRKNSSSGAAYADTITLNGVKVSGGTGTSSNYEYTINGNISVKLGYSSNSNGGYDGDITITEE